MKFEIKDKKIVKTINTIRALIKGTKFEGVTYVVGGFVRDTLMGETSNDLDIVVNLPSGGIDLANTLTELTVIVILILLYILSMVQQVFT